MRRGDEGAVGKSEVPAVELADCPHSADDKEDQKEETEIGEEGVDREHDEDGGIIGGEVAKVVVYAALCLAQVLWFADALEVEEFGYWL